MSIFIGMVLLLSLFIQVISGHLDKTNPIDVVTFFVQIGIASFYVLDAA